MRTAVVFFASSSRDKMLAIAKALARGMEKQGNQVDLVDAERDANTKLTIHHYVAVGSVVASRFGGKIPDQLKSYLASAGVVSGKRSYAFVLKSTFGAAKALARLMKVMEGEGMFLKNSDIISSEVEAEEIGKRLHIAQ